jgi:cobalt/nickel transport system permease protein
MVCESFAHGDSFLHQLHPGLRVLTVAALALVLLGAGTWPAALFALSLGVGLACAARLPLGPLVHRLRTVNLFVALLLLVYPWGGGGRELWRVGGLAYGFQGLEEAVLIGLRLNALVLSATALLGTMELTTLGHALGDLRVPGALVQLLMFTVRYLDLLHHEYDRLRRAMRARGFRARPTMHTLRTLGHLVGMLLVRAFDRSERVLAAMKCRGFRGRFPAFHESHWTRRDGLFAAFGGMLLAITLAMGAL